MRCGDCKWFERTMPTGDGAWEGVCLVAARGMGDEDRKSLRDTLVSCGLTHRDDLAVATTCLAFARPGERGRMDAERERAHWLRERGYTRWKPAYHELTEEQRGWLMVGNIDPEDALGRVLDALPAERLKPLRKAYEPRLGYGIDAYDVGVRMAKDALNMGMVGAEVEDWFPLSPGDIDREVLDLLLLWAREEAGEFYE